MVLFSLLLSERVRLCYALTAQVISGWNWQGFSILGFCCRGPWAQLYYAETPDSWYEFLIFIFQFCLKMNKIIIHFYLQIGNQTYLKMHKITCNWKIQQSSKYFENLITQVNKCKLTGHQDQCVKCARKTVLAMETEERRRMEVCVVTFSSIYELLNRIVSWKETTASQIFLKLSSLDCRGVINIFNFQA